MKILVTGATGQLGSKIVGFLAEKMEKSAIVVGTTNPASEKAEELKAQGFEVRQTDFENQELLEEAFNGIDKLFIISTFGDAETVTRQQNNVVEAAKKAKVGQLFYSSAPKADSSDFFLAQLHALREDIVKQSGIPYVFIRNNWYIENELMSAQGSINGTPWLTSIGGGKTGWVLRADLAEATAALLASEQIEKNIYELGGENLTQQQFVDVLNEVTGKEIPLMNVDDETYRAALGQANLPEQTIMMLVMIQQGIRNGGLELESTDLEELLGRKPVALKEALQQLLG